MIAAALVVAAASVTDPRLALAELQLAGETGRTLEAVEERLEAEPGASAALGLHYLRGHLLEEEGRTEEANDAFARALDAAPSLQPYSLFRLARNWLAQGHPEVAAGLFARVLSQGAPDPLLEPATSLLIHTLARGGDCRLLTRLDVWPVRTVRKRRLEIARADCELRRGDRETAAARLLALVERDQEDEAARAAAERLRRLASTTPTAPDAALLLGRVFHRHRLFELSIDYLRRGLAGAPGAPLGEPAPEHGDDLYALARSYFWQSQYLVAAAHFGRLAAASEVTGEKAKALYQQARSYELSGNWNAAVQSFRLAYLAEPEGRWADAALLSALRVEWRTGHEENALDLYQVLSQKRGWRRLYGRAALFLAASDLVRGRSDRAGTWLEQGERAGVDWPAEIAYWRARLAELENRPQDAVLSYLEALAGDRLHPFGQAARARLGREELIAGAQRIGRSLAAGDDSEDLYRAWALLGESDPEAAGARARLEKILRNSPATREFLDIAFRPPAEWPLWSSSLRLPEEQFLALGLWREGAGAVPRHFPVAEPSLGLTGSRLLSRAGAYRESLLVAEILGERAAERLPAGLEPPALRKIVYPLPWAEAIRESAERFGVEPHLLAALIREESRFDPDAVSGASARGLTQMTLPTALRLAPAIGRPDLTAEDLHRPRISIALGAAYLAELAARYGNQASQVIAAYNAGERQSELWRSYCYSREPEEFLTKIGFPETRSYLARVLSSRAEYLEIYGEELTP